MKWIRVPSMKRTKAHDELRGDYEKGVMYFRTALNIKQGQLGPVKFEVSQSGAPDGETKIIVIFPESEHINAGEVQTNQKNLIIEALRAHLDDGGSKEGRCIESIMMSPLVQQDWDKSNVCPHCGYVSESGTDGCSCMMEEGRQCINLNCCGKPYLLVDPDWKEEEQ